MATKKTAGLMANPGKKQIAREIHAVLLNTMNKWKVELGEKKIEKRIKKATRLLMEGFKPVKVKKASEKKAVVKKAPVKTAPAKKAAKKPGADKSAAK